MKRLDYYWYARSPWLLLLTPLSLLYRFITAVRRLAYRLGILRTTRIPLPVIVVGNITVGGTGKTPLVAWLAEHLRARGYLPGIVSRGYGGQAGHWPQPVEADSDPAMVGDEAVLLAALTGCPMAVAPDRVAAARALVAQGQCDIIISDDGLQHYALERDVELAVVDGERRFGNGLLLPAGPLREPLARLRQVDLVVVNGRGHADEYSMTLQQGEACRLDDSAMTQPLQAFGSQRVHAVAGIGHPERFFSALQRAGLQLETHAFADHHAYQPDDIRFADDGPVIMTGKDAVKCRQFAEANHWYVPVAARLPAAFGDRLDALLAARTARAEPAV